MDDLAWCACALRRVGRCRKQFSKKCQWSVDDFDTFFIPEDYIAFSNEYIYSFDHGGRGKGKKIPSRGKRKIFSKEENDVPKAPSNGSNNLGPVAGIAALFILIVAIFWRPTPSSSTYQSADATVENVTMEASNEVPVNESAKVEKEPEIETPVQPESTPGFYMNAFHDVDTFPTNKEDLLHYLKYDDGYAVCLRKEDLQDLDEYGVWDLKKTKLQYLEYIANDEAHWIAESHLTRHDTPLVASWR